MPGGRKTNAIARPIAVTISRRVAEFSAILRLTGLAPAVMDVTERYTSSALTRPRPSPMPKNTPIMAWPLMVARATATAVRAAHRPSSRTGRKATDGNTSGASGAGVVTRLLAIASASKRM